MLIPLRVLILEDQPAYAELMLYELRRAGYDPDWQRVETEADYCARLDSTLNLILADYHLPTFDVLRALDLLRARNLDIPFIVVTGSISGEQAVDCMKQGAADYLPKDRLASLGPAVTTALEQRHLRAERRQAHATLDTFLQQCPALIFMKDLDGRYRLVNCPFEKLFHVSQEQAIGRNDYDIFPGEVADEFLANDQKVLAAGSPLEFEEVVLRREGVRLPPRPSSFHSMTPLGHSAVSVAS